MKHLNGLIEIHYTDLEELCNQTLTAIVTIRGLLLDEVKAKKDRIINKYRQLYEQSLWRRFVLFLFPAVPLTDDEIIKYYDYYGLIRCELRLLESNAKNAHSEIETVCKNAIRAIPLGLTVYFSTDALGKMKELIQNAKDYAKE